MTFEYTPDFAQEKVVSNMEKPMKPYKYDEEEPEEKPEEEINKSYDLVTEDKRPRKTQYK